MSKLKTLLAKYAEMREEKIIEKWIENTGTITDPSDGCGCFLPIVILLAIIGYIIYKLFIM